MLRAILAVALTWAYLSSPLLSAAEKTPAELIAPFVDEQALVVAHLDLTRVDPPAIVRQAVEILGLYHTLPATFSTGYGFDAIAIALLAKSRPLGVLPAALLWGGLRNGAGLMQVRTGVSIDLINVIQALIIMGLAADHLVRTLRRRRAGGPCP